MLRNRLRFYDKDMPIKIEPEEDMGEIRQLCLNDFYSRVLMIQAFGPYDVRKARRERPYSPL